MASGQGGYLNLYLNRINESPLLTPYEEVRLGWRIINDSDPEARERMIKSNLRLVVSIAKMYLHRGLPLLDLIEEGNFGLIHAVDEYDPALGNRFSTFATWWIKQPIKKALGLEGNFGLHRPLYTIELRKGISKLQNQLSRELDRSPTMLELYERHIGEPRPEEPGKKTGQIRF